MARWKHDQQVSGLIDSQPVNGDFIYSAFPDGKRFATFGTSSDEGGDSSLYPPSLSRTLLLSAHPRFVWRARLMDDQVPLLEVLIDATGMERSSPVYGIVWHDHLLARVVGDILRHFEAETRSWLTP